MDKLVDSKAFEKMDGVNRRRRMDYHRRRYTCAIKNDALCEETAVYKKTRGCSRVKPTTRSPTPIPATREPTRRPTRVPSNMPTLRPTAKPTTRPTMSPRRRYISRRRSSVTPSPVWPTPVPGPLCYDNSYCEAGHLCSTRRRSGKGECQTICAEDDSKCRINHYCTALVTSRRRRVKPGEVDEEPSVCAVGCVDSSGCESGHFCTASRRRSDAVGTCRFPTPLPTPSPTQPTPSPTRRPTRSPTPRPTTPEPTPLPPGMTWSPTPSPTPAPTALQIAIHTCEHKYAGSTDGLYIRFARVGAWQAVSSSPSRSTWYRYNFAAEPGSTAELKFDGGNGLCLDQATVNGVAVSQGLPRWFDNPCNGDYGDYPCSNYFFLLTGPPTSPPVTIRVHTCSTKSSGSPERLEIRFTPDSNWITFKGKSNLDRNSWYTFTGNAPVGATPELRITGTNGLCLDMAQVNGVSKSSGFPRWLDMPCNGKYGSLPCSTSVMLTQ
eukprot:TRINITY_DN22538_c0_g1_i2.p1 TRINITY_DN22538_c0_g1~~TRINITY_DN22538_c0_g1_i2.p1  ORF type:complete len:493 (+),score=17.02 TRINITY_DN22538_c0_g1_i2:163-1641(+)